MECVRNRARLQHPSEAEDATNMPHWGKFVSLEPSRDALRTHRGLPPLLSTPPILAFFSLSLSLFQPFLRTPVFISLYTSPSTRERVTPSFSPPFLRPSLSHARFRRNCFFRSFAFPRLILDSSFFSLLSLFLSLSLCRSSMSQLDSDSSRRFMQNSQRDFKRFASLSSVFAFSKDVGELGKHIVNNASQLPLSR